MNLQISKEEKSQTVNFVYKSILGFIPGGHIIDELVGFRASVQQERLNKFAQSLKDGFESITEKSFEPENLKSEKFIDVFDIIIRKVAATSSEGKLKRYRNILLNAIYEKTEFEMFFKYVSLVEEITEIQILILSCLCEYTNLSEQDIMKWLANPEKYPNYLLNFAENDEFKLFNGQLISKYEITFLINELKSIGIIVIAPENVRPVQYGASSKPIEVYKLSPIGINFLEFIKEQGK